MNSDLANTITKGNEQDRILTDLAITAAVGGPRADAARKEASRIMQERLGKSA